MFCVVVKGEKKREDKRSNPYYREDIGENQVTAPVDTNRHQQTPTACKMQKEVDGPAPVPGRHPPMDHESTMPCHPWQGGRTGSAGQNPLHVVKHSLNISQNIGKLIFCSYKVTSTQILQSLKSCVLSVVLAQLRTRARCRAFGKYIPLTTCERLAALTAAQSLSLERARPPVSTGGENMHNGSADRRLTLSEMASTKL